MDHTSFKLWLSSQKQILESVDLIYLSNQQFKISQRVSINLEIEEDKEPLQMD